MRRKVLIFLSLLFLFFNTTYSAYTNSSLKISYDKLIVKLQSKFVVDKQYSILKKIDSKIKYILENKRLSPKNKSIIDYLYSLNLIELNKINILRQKTEKADFIVSKEKELRKRIKAQQLKEFIIKDKLKKDKENIIIPSYIKALIGNKIKLIALNSKNEFYEDSEIKKIIFTKYYNIDSSMSSFLSNKTGYIAKLDGQDNFWFIEDFNLETKLAYSKFRSTFKGFYSSQTPFFLENHIYYTFVFSKFNYINDSYGLYKSDLISNNIDINNLVIFLNDKGIFNFVSDYNKVKLISSDIINNVDNKWYFLKELADDKKYLLDDTDADFLFLKNKAIELTKGLSKEDKIKTVYSWILSNIEYTKNIDLKDYRIYSGIKTFSNKDGACEGYSKIMVYMLMFSGFTDLEAIRGYVIDAQDFPRVGHAWVRVGDYYYDPTFDDPLGATKTKIFNNYFYYKLPKDLFYTNRYLRENLPENLKSKSLKQRSDIVNNLIYDFAKKNPNLNYKLLNGAKLKIENNLGNKDLNIEDFKKIITYQILTDDYKVEISGKYKTIKTYKYIPVNDDNIENIVKSNYNYNLEGLFLFKRQLKDGTNDYILSNDITYKN